MGFVAAVPYILKSFIGPIGGISADILIKRKLLTVRGVRALFYGAGIKLYAFNFTRNLVQGLVPKVPYFWTSNGQIVVLEVP